MTEKQYDGMILENLEDLDDITALAGRLPDAKEKEALLALPDAVRNYRNMGIAFQGRLYYNARI